MPRCGVEEFASSTVGREVGVEVELGAVEWGEAMETVGLVLEFGEDQDVVAAAAVASKECLELFFTVVPATDGTCLTHRLGTYWYKYHS